MAQEALRSGDVMFELKTVFSAAVDDSDAAAAPAEPRAIEEVERFIVAKPFFRPYMLVLCKISEPDANQCVRIVHGSDADTEDGEPQLQRFWFITSFQLCTQVLQKHNGRCASVSIKFVNYKRFSRCCSLNVSPLLELGHPQTVFHFLCLRKCLILIFVNLKF